ncbi:hypothetical protein ACRE_030480 [Hapsidospora chrysogenum ATCC 11550]|uniref:Uncharacterized protein n=1 Tax=Hapsidospora chrysogenum (strain ATCC 11550 / CBS 779.69 / DSM 880 / IAM 14645 / JCM 23072 / IMI 49137) TaxID=857340 RepID=A0A086T9M2_HAPC1|nr:hypothetical protein ACRE_030480 [Hapsidospora chrysogenum ATCC 11550]
MASKADRFHSRRHRDHSRIRRRRGHLILKAIVLQVRARRCRSRNASTRDDGIDNEEARKEEWFFMNSPARNRIDKSFSGFPIRAVTASPDWAHAARRQWPFAA